ncbi:hypothetical protein QO002_005732 [Pararhizobium capsulatum DSM 1112]|uniref:Uncharacterized protein n=1 Tax=Pararhizobium capsulatum DSM 1112 TaxID=1121113 RepID=A0ABU0C0U9_9HYPH|nr:hypothetical protein [Pararhizobium capsulatum]MDQ0323526.1 hypothetical protein [Pararhizobium capsulatum DSM 1112]
MLIALVVYFVMAFIFVVFSSLEGVEPQPSWRPTRVLGLFIAIVWPGILLPF